MKKIILTLFAIALISISWTTVKHGFGSVGGFSGSPLDGKDCSTCHPKNIKDAGYWVYPTNLPNNGFIPGDTLSLYMFATQSGMQKAGFEMTTEDSQKNKVGTFVLTDTLQTRLTNKGSVTHTGSSNTAFNEFKSWKVNLHIPLNAPDTFKVYTCFNLNNGSFGKADTTRLSTFTLYKSPIGYIQNQLTNSEFSCYPNPCVDYLNILTETAWESYSIYNINGELIRSNNYKPQIDVSELSSGAYFLQTVDGQQTSTRKFIKR